MFLGASNYLWNTEVFRQWEGIFNMADDRRGTIQTADDFNNIETEGGRLGFKPFEIAYGRARQAILLMTVNGRARAAEILVGAGFDLDKNKRIMIAADQINFIMQANAQTPPDDLIPFALKVTFGHAFAPDSGPLPQRRALSASGYKSLDAFQHLRLSRGRFIVQSWSGNNCKPLPREL